MKSFDATSTIQSPPDAVWAVLTDASKYTDWDSGVKRIEGTIAPGEKLKIESEANPGRAFPAKVTQFEPAKNMTWSGGTPLGLFKGVRTFTLSPVEGGATRFDVREEYSGPMLPLIWRTMPDLQPSFDQFANGLKSRVEGTG